MGFRLGMVSHFRWWCLLYRTSVGAIVDSDEHGVLHRFPGAAFGDVVAARRAGEAELNLHNAECVTQMRHPQSAVSYTTESYT